MSESDQYPEILGMLHASGFYAWRQNSGAFKKGKRYVRVAFKGCPDIIGFCRTCGLAIFIESKSPTGKSSPEQVEFGKIAQASGALYSCGETYEQIIAMVNQHKINSHVDFRPRVDRNELQQPINGDKRLVIFSGRRSGKMKAIKEWYEREKTKNVRKK